MSEIPPTSADTKADVDLSGRVLGDYQLLRRLGRGGMADVFLAEQRSLRRQVAFKVLKRSLANDPAYVQRFHREAQAAASLVHANIVQIHEVGCIDGIHFIAQEYVKGQNLRQLLNRAGSMDAPTAVNIMRQVAAALQKAGEQSIIHRDIKPENILLAANGEVKVADFGLARILGDKKAVDLTQVDMTMGTPLYMSPEQVEGRQVDQRSDLYSFGVTCYYMLSGRPPFDGETALSIAVQHVKTEPRRLEELRPDLPIALCCIIHKMIAKRPKDRFQHALELLHQLRTLQIDGLDDGWPSGLDHWESSQLRAAVDLRLAATHRLETAMKTEAQHIRRSRHVWAWLAICAAAASVVGGLLAKTTAPPSLLRDVLSVIAVPRQQTVLEQYRYAFWVQTEEAWKSVEKYFPSAEVLQADERAQRQLYARLAKQRLAELYMQDANYGAAMEIFNEFANLEETAVEFRAFGIAGQAIVHSHRGELELMTQKLDKVFEYRQHLYPTMRITIERLNRERRQRERSQAPSGELQ